MATQTSPSFAGLTVPEDDIWFDKALQDELDQKARGEKQTPLPFGFLHGLGAAPFEQNINIGGPGYTRETREPFSTILTPEEQEAARNITQWNVPSPGMGPLFNITQKVADQPLTMENITRETTPYSALPRIMSDRPEGESVSKWDIGEVGLDLLDVGGPLDTTTLKLAPDIGKILPEFSQMIAGVMPQQARNLLKGSKVVDTEGTPTRVYHGTKGIFRDFLPEYQDSGSLMGRGFYFTESPEIAGEYSTRKGWRDLATGIYGGAPNVHANYLNLQKPLDMEGVAKEDVITKMSEKLFTIGKEKAAAERLASLNRGHSGGAEIASILANNDSVMVRSRHLREMTARIYNFMGSPVIRDFDSMEQFEKAAAMAQKESELIEELIVNRQWDKAEKAITQFFKKSVRTNQEVFDVMTEGENFFLGSSPYIDRDYWTDGLEELGYDGITHIGGGSWDGGKGIAHRVWIVFDKDHVFDAHALEGMHKSPDILPPSGDFSKMLSTLLSKGIGLPPHLRMQIEGVSDLWSKMK